MILVSANVARNVEDQSRPALPIPLHLVEPGEPQDLVSYGELRWSWFYHYGVSAPVVELEDLRKPQSGPFETVLLRYSAGMFQWIEPTAAHVYLKKVVFSGTDGDDDCDKVN